MMPQETSYARDHTSDDPSAGPPNLTHRRSTADEHTGFTQAQQAYFVGIMETVVQKAAREAVAQAMSEMRRRDDVGERPRTRFAEPPTPQMLRTPTQEIPRSNIDGLGWNSTPVSQSLPGNHRLDELGYFCPNLPEQSDAAVVTVGKDVYYRDVNKFITRVRDVAAARGEEVLKLHLSGNLRGAAMDWYTDQIDKTAKLALRYSPLEQGWIRLLADRFKPVFNEAIDRPYAQTPYYYYYSSREGLFNTSTTNRTIPSKPVDIGFFYPDSWDTTKTVRTAPRATHLYDDYDYDYSDDELPNNQSHLQSNQHGQFDQQAHATYWPPTDKPNRLQGQQMVDKPYNHDNSDSHNPRSIQAHHASAYDADPRGDVNTPVTQEAQYDRGPITEDHHMKGSAEFDLGQDGQDGQDDPHLEDYNYDYPDQPVEAVCANEEEDDAERVELPYAIHDDLYSTNHVGNRRLVIPDNMAQEVFNQAHDESNHAAFKRAFEKLHGLTMRRMRHQLEAYIRECPKCATHQTRPHKPYGDLQPILSLPNPFYAMSIDFTLALPETEGGYNAAVTMTDKFTKALLGNCQELVKDYEEFHRLVRQYYQPHRGGGRCRTASQLQVTYRAAYRYCLSNSQRRYRYVRPPSSGEASRKTGYQRGH
jgi:Integrase zinc binding domain